MLPYGRHSLHVRKITRQEGVGKVEEFKVGKSTKYRWNSAIECITIKINEVQILEVFKVFIVESSSEKCKGDVKVDKEIWKTRNIASECCLLGNNRSYKNMMKNVSKRKLSIDCTQELFLSKMYTFV